MTGTADSARRPGRPRSREADAAILGAALDLLLERGAARTSIEQVAQRAGVTRATVYRRFADKTALLVEAIEALHADRGPGGPDWPDVERMIADIAEYLGDPRNRKVLRRLVGAADDHPELLRAYLDTHGRRRDSAVRASLARARDDRQLLPGRDVEILQQLVNGAVLHHLGAYPDTVGAHEIEAYLAAMLRQAGYRPPPS